MTPRYLHSIDYQDPGALIRTLRERAGLTPTELARRAGVAPTTVYSVERRKNPTWSTMVALLHAMDFGVGLVARPPGVRAMIEVPHV